MKRPLFLFAVLAIGLASSGSAALLPDNIWPNSEFEAGTDLDDPLAGVPDGWKRGGNDATICQVTRDAAVSPTHALAIIDQNEEAFGEWYADFPLPSTLGAGQSLNVQWYEAFSISGGEMRVSALFFDAAGAITLQNHFVVQGDSEGWTGSPNGSPLVKKNRRLTIPVGAARLRISLVSGGSSQTTGTVILDDLSVSVALPGELLAGNFWPNPTFESGQTLDDPANAVPAGWTRAGDDLGICLLTSESSVSPSHALLVSDQNEAGFGAWAGEVELAGSAAPGDTLDVQWFEAFQVDGAAEMRLTASFLDSEGTALGNATHWIARGNSAGWGGTLAQSTFTRHNEALLVPASATKLRIELVSGGPASTTGQMAIDNLSVARPAKPVVLYGNLWPNPTFELGENLDQASGTPASWTRGGSEPAICQVTRALSASPTHALAVVDESATGSGEWSAELNLGPNLVGIPSLSVQWFEVFNVSTAGEMRLSAQFFNGTQIVGESHFAAQGSSAGWKGTLAQSSFTRRQEVLSLPSSATKLRLTLASGTSPQTTGVMAIDDLSVAPPLAPPQTLPGSFWLNPGFEEGVQLDAPGLGVPTGWARGGSIPAIDQILTDRFKSPSHALAVVDTSTDGYGEWYQFLPLNGIAVAGDILQVQWFEIFHVSSPGEMRLSVLFFNAAGGIVTQKHFLARDDSEGWTGDLATSPFVARLEEVDVPDEADRLLVTLTSGGPGETTGTLLIDDLSIRVKAIVITNVHRTAEGISITWESSAGAVYALESSNDLSAGSFSVLAGAGSITANGNETTYVDTSIGGVATRFYRVVLVTAANPR